jgi:predicted amidohydrolase
MVPKNMEVLLISRVWPAQRLEDWKNLVSERAIENYFLLLHVT